MHGAAKFFSHFVNICPLEKPLFFAQDPQKQMLRFYDVAAGLRRFIAREKNDAARFFCIAFEHSRPLLGGGTADDLRKAGRVDVLGEGLTHLVRSHIKVALSGAQRLVER